MYQIINDASVRHLPSGTTFPVPPVESFGHDYQRWLDEGNTPEPAPEPLPVPPPNTVTMRQARLALLGAGMLGAVTTAINNLPEPNRSVATIEWEYSQEVHRNRALIQELGPLLGLSTEQLDGLFTVAATL